MTFIAWLQRHRTLARLIPHRVKSRLVWRELEADPTFVADLREAEADFAAGRFYRWDPETGETIPNPDWPKDGPQP